MSRFDSIDLSIPLHNMLKTIDIEAETTDLIQIEVQRRSPTNRVLYIHYNGITILRICQIKDNQLSIELPKEDN